MSNLIPDGWSTGLLPEFVEINPKLNQAVKLTDDIPVSFIKMEDVSNNAVVTKKRVRKYSDVSKGFTKFNNKDVLVAKITPCFENGKGGFVDNLTNGVGFGSTEFHVMRAKNNFDSSYLYQYTNFSFFRLKAEASMCGTGGQRRVQTDFLRTHQLISPPLPEQQKIAAILTSVDDVIERTQAQIDKLKDLKTGMMQELLTRGVGVDGKPHTEFKDSPVGKIPKGWDVVQLSDTGKWKGGGTPSKSNKSYWAGSIPWVSPKDMKLDLISRTKDYITEGAIKGSSTNLITKNSLLMVVRSGILKHTLPVAISGCDLTVNQDMKALSVSENYCVNFIFYYLQAHNHKVLRATLKAGNTVESIDFNEFGKFLIPSPSIEEQINISEVVASISNKIGLKEHKLSALKNTKKALMQDLLTGKVRVKVDS